MTLVLSLQFDCCSRIGPTCDSVCLRLSRSIDRAWSRLGCRLIPDSVLRERERERGEESRSRNKFNIAQPQRGGGVGRANVPPVAGDRQVRDDVVVTTTLVVDQCLGGGGIGQRGRSAAIGTSYAKDFYYDDVRVSPTIVTTRLSPNAPRLRYQPALRRKHSAVPDCFAVPGPVVNIRARYAFPVDDYISGRNVTACRLSC